MSEHIRRYSCTLSWLGDFNRLLLLIICCLLLGCRSKKEEFLLRKDQALAIDNLIQRKKTDYHIPGIAVAIIKNGEVVKKITLGIANVDSEAPVFPSTSFNLASTTKSFTATGIMLLVSDGRLKLSDPIGTIIKNLPLTWQNITIRQLLSHTSGLPDITRRVGELDLIADAWEPALKIIYHSPFQFKPGEKWAYTQTNYVLLSLVIEKIAGMTFEKFMADRLFNKLHMQNSFFVPPNDTGKHIASNYELNEQAQPVKRNLRFPYFVHAAGGLWSSLDDLIRWNAAFDSGTILKPELVKEMWSAALLNDGSSFRINGKTIGYGLGWVVDDASNKRTAGHSGGNSTAYRRYIDEHFTVIVLHNGVLNPDDLIESIAEIMRSEPGEAEPTAQVRLWEGAKAGDTSAIIKAIKEKANIYLLDKRKSESGRFALNWAAWFNHPEAIQLLLRYGAKIDEQNKTGYTALHHAAEAGSLQAIKALLDAGANPNIQNRNGQTPAETAAAQNHPEIVKLINSLK